MAAALGVALTVALGVWQWGRAADKLALQAQLQERTRLPALDASAVAALDGASAPLFRPVRLVGRWLPRWTVYLDNRQMAGHIGFHVLTPLQLHGERAVVLVQRGWVPRDFQERTRLPAVDTPDSEVVIEGRIAPPPVRLHQFGGGEPGRIRQNLDLPAFAAETGLPLITAMSVQQTGTASEGLRRDWPEPVLGVGKHHGYAFQWWALAALIAILYVWFQFIAPRRARPAA